MHKQPAMGKAALGSGVCILIFLCCWTSAHGQSSRNSTGITDRTREMDDDDLILFNVAVKGRVVELLANEIARTEIIRALLYEYAKECVQNITVLEKSCIDCMMERCENRLAECEIKSIRLSEIIRHEPSPIKGLQFLSQAPKKVSEELRAFADNARADILRDVPSKLMGEGEKIVHSEVDESLTDLKDNINTEKTLQTITIHFQKAANNIHLLPDLGEKLGTLIVENGGHAINLAETLATKLRNSRPYIDSMQQNGERVKEQAPSVFKQLGERVSTFKERVVGVFNSALDTFNQALDNPNTPVVQEVVYPRNQQQMLTNLNMVPGSTGPRMPPHLANQIPPPPFPARGHIVTSQFQTDFGPFKHVQTSFQNGNRAGQFLQNLQSEFQNHLRNLLPNQNRGWIQNAFPMNGMQPVPQQGPHFQNRQFTPEQGMQGQHFPAVQNSQFQQQNSHNGFVGQSSQQRMIQNVPQNPAAFPQNMQIQNPNLPSPPQGVPQGAPQVANTAGAMGSVSGQQLQSPSSPQSQTQNAQFTAGQNSNDAQFPQIQVQPTQQQVDIGQGQGQQFASNQPVVQGRRRRQTKPDCEKLEYDPETYCKTYESQCHNCTLEKRLRFEVCGEGVEKARDEIKRLDSSVQNYLEAYEDHISSGPLVLKVELNDKNRLVKTNSYYDAYVTAKIGASIFRYKTKMILNINDLRTSGSQIGDEIWEKLWEQNVFEEAQRLDIVHNDNGDMGQLHKLDVKIDTKKAHAHKSSASRAFTVLTYLLTGLASVFPFLLL